MSFGYLPNPQKKKEKASPGFAPDFDDEGARRMSRARSRKKKSRRVSRQAEGAVTAAVIIRDVGDAMGGERNEHRYR